MKLPKPGTKVEDLKCPKCGLSLKVIELQGPVGLLNCTDNVCPQKPASTGG